SDEESGIARLWRDSDGEAAARFCHELIDAAGDFPPIPARHYPALFEALASGIVVRPAFGRHPRLAIWGLVEARLQQADLVVLGGLNEGTWPGPAAFDPWMSRQMREEFGIALLERAIGIAAHDFMQAIGAPELALTRATRREGVPTIPSRWLLRLDAVLRATGLEGALAPEPEIDDAVALLDLPERRRPLPAVAPRPPVKARPRFRRMARWFVEQGMLRRADIADSISEMKGKLAIAAPAGPFTVTAIADRIDCLRSGEVAILDYKTGSLPSKPEIDNGIAVQL